LPITIGSAVCHISKSRITDFIVPVQKFQKRDTRIAFTFFRDPQRQSNPGISAFLQLGRLSAWQSRVPHTLTMTLSVWAMSTESLYHELTLPKPAPASVVVAAVTAQIGTALLIKTLAVVGNRNSFEGDRNKLRPLTEAAQRESSKLAEAAEDDVTGAPDRKRTAVR
jgi:hypothetical protein